MATVEALATRGYAGASTTEICRIAGVSRGAQLHHYPAKSALMAAAVNHLFERRHALLRAAIKKVPAGGDRLRMGLETLWSIYSTDAHAAWMELVIAGRTDPELQAHLLEVDAKLVAEGNRTCAELLGVPADKPWVSSVTRMVLALFEGLALNRALGVDDEERKRVLVAFEMLVSSAVGRRL
jgi:AcrR family transcriptional regulator